MSSYRQPRTTGGRTPLWIAPATIVIGAAAGVFLTVLVQLIGNAAGASTAHPGPAVQLAANVMFDLAFVGAAVYMTAMPRWMGRADYGYVRVSVRTLITSVVAAGALYYLVTWVYQQAFALHRTDRLPSDMGIHSSTWAAIGAGAFVCVIAPICEEFFFRGFLFGVLRNIRVSLAGHDLGPWIAALIVAVVFGAAHYQSADPQALIPLGFLGFVLCIMRWKTGSLYPGMALHSVNNCIALGVTEFSWGLGPILLCVSGALATIWLLTGWLSRPQPATADA